MVGIVFASQLHLFALRTGGRMSWRDSFFWEVPRWCLWAFFAPIVTAIAKRYPWRREHAGRLITLHTSCAVALSFLHIGLFVLVFHFLRLSIDQNGSLLETLQFAFPLDFHVGIAVYFLLLLLKEYRESEQRLTRLQSELTRAQLHALKMQLHPHFLFNTLNSISSYMRTDVEVADEMIGRLGDFLRMTLQNTGKQEILLEKELEFLKQYLAIEQLRFQERLQAEYDIAPETLSAFVPNLILQPVAENAIRYGVAGKAGIGRIRVHAKQVNEKLQITIEDNGSGFPAEIEEGIGILTTRERLEQMYGGEASLKLENQMGGGAVVTMVIPFHTREKAA
jgi:two-component system LytT family sensor kinase